MGLGNISLPSFSMSNRDEGVVTRLLATSYHRFSGVNVAVQLPGFRS
jgi:hypothetical protein